MKKISLLVIFLGVYLIGYSQVENIAKDVLKAYKDRNAEELKKHAAGIFKFAITNSFFEDEAIKSDLKAVDSWNGEIKEIRYSTGDLMGNTVTLASAYYADNPDNSNEVCVVILSSTDKSNWVMFAGGLSSESKAEFQKLALSLDESIVEKPVKSSKKCNIEMANGDKFIEVDEETISKCINTLDDDNFFVILSSGDDYMQAAYSEQGFIIQFSENEEQFEAKDYLTKEQANEIMIKYFLNENWKEGNEWIVPSY